MIPRSSVVLLQHSGPAGGGGVAATPLTATQSLRFASGDAALNNAPAVSTGVTNAWSIAIWCKDSTISSGKLLTVTEHGTNNSLIDLNISSGALWQVSAYDSGGTNNKTYTFGAPATDTWNLAIVTWNGTTLATYVNGAEVTPTKTVDNSITMADATRRIAINSNSGATQTSAGVLYFSAGLWSSALSAAEISSLWTNKTADWRAAAGSYASQANLQHYYVFGEDTTNNTTSGEDYGPAGTDVDLILFVGVTVTTDLESDVPA